MKLPALLPPEAVVAVVDSREQLPLDLAPLRTVEGTLYAGDYSIRGLENQVAIERKSLTDLLACVGSERERFERELLRLRGYCVKAVVCECSWADLEAGQWRNDLSSQAVQGSVLGWIGWGIPFLFCGSHEAAGRAVARLLFIHARRDWQRLRALAQKLEPEGEPAP